jgi:hypothetical protein
MTTRVYKITRGRAIGIAVSLDIEPKDGNSYTDVELKEMLARFEELEAAF